VPWRRLSEAVAAADVLDWQERIVIDTTNPLGPPDFKVADLDGRTSSEVVAELVPGARLVKAFNTLTPAVLGSDPRTFVGRRVIFLSGNHPGANERVTRLADRVGWRSSIWARWRPADGCNSSRAAPCRRSICSWSPDPRRIVRT
jgi:Predicted dinucleotide-binding enzymes